MGRRNTGLKSRCLVFGPEGFAGASEGQAPIDVVLENMEDRLGIARVNTG